MKYGFVHLRATALVEFSAASYVVDEDGTATITVQKTGAAAATVNYATTSGSAQPGVNFLPVAGSLSWSENDRSPRTFNVPLLNSQLLQSELTVGLDLGQPSVGALLGVRRNATLFINIDQPQYLNLLSIRDRLRTAYFDTYPTVT